MWALNWLERTKQDLSYAMRAFARTPGFAAVVIITLALGIGATTAIFSIVDAVWLHPLLYPHANRMVVIWEKLKRDPNAPPVFDSYRDFLAWKSSSESFEQLAPATWATGGQILTGAGPARNVLAMPVGIDFFSLLSIKPELGRTFQPDDLNRGCSVILQRKFWMMAFAGRKDVLGSHLALSEKACTVVGVMPEGFTFYPDAASMWMLITPDSEIGHDPEHANVGVFGLLKPDVSLQCAQREMERLYANEHRKDPGGLERTPIVHPLAEQFSYLTGPNLRLSVLVLFGAVSFVLLIACVNIANLLLGRSLVRQKELAVRAALGSGRMRLVRQLLTEGLLLSVAGATLGTLLAMGAVHYFRVLHPIAMPPGNPVSVNRQVLGFTAVLAMITALVFGLVPALKASRVDLIHALRASGRSASFSPATRTFGKVLVAAEVMLSLALLAGASLLIESVYRLTSVPLGFRTNHVFTVPLELPKWNYPEDGQRARFYDEALARAANLPGMESTAFASSLPLNGGRWGNISLAVEGRPEPAPANARHDVSQVSITPDYFQVMGVRLQRGRLFENRDRTESQRVAIVNEALVQKYFLRENPIGQRIKIGEPGTDRFWLTIVGVTASERDRNFFQEMAWEDIPLVFRPVAQDPPLRGFLLLHPVGKYSDLGSTLQKQISELDRNVPVGEVETLDERLSHTLAYPRFRALVLAAFAGIALLLAGVGLYGVLSQGITQRTQEFGVRMALGAPKRNILMLVIRQGMAWTGVGIGAGLIAVSFLTKFLSSLLYGVKATDPWTLAGVSALLISVALLAVYLPAKRAASVDPTVALRYE